MLSVSTPNVHRAIRPKTPESSPSPPSSPSSRERQARHTWNCEYTVFPKNRCRHSGARKKIISGDLEDATIGIDVHCQSVRFEQAALEMSAVDSADEVFSNDIEKPFAETPTQAQSASTTPQDDLPLEEETDRPNNSIPFVKSAQMQRNKFVKNREEEDIEKIEENDLDLTTENIGRAEDAPSLQSGEVNVVVLENKIDDDDDDMDNIFDGPKSKIVKDPTEEKEAEHPKSAEEKKDRVLSGRMLRARELLSKPDTYVHPNAEEYTNEDVPGIPGDDAREVLENCDPFMRENDWDTEVDSSLLPNLGDHNSTVGVANHERLDNNCHFLDEIETHDDNTSHYMIGFPNPIGENRCWLNATLHAMFALPLMDHLESLRPDALRNVSHLTKTFMALRLFWSEGRDRTPKTYQTIKTFKESLGILDESYPSQRQQDVSEFLTMFLNYVKTDFEKLASRRVETSDQMANSSEEAENISENMQNTRAVRCLPQTPTKERPPLADISPRKRKFRETGSDSGGDGSPKSRKITYSVQDLLSPRVNRLTKPTDPSYKVHTPPHHPANGIQRSKENSDFCKNPIDRYVLLHMMEHYDCKSCSKHRQRKVDNLMIYVDLPPGSENQTVSLHEAVAKSLEPEERDLTCKKCKHDKHSVYTSFRAFPKILMVQVNRYGMCEDGSVAKFNTPVEIPETLELDLGASEAENGNTARQSYEPACVIAHVGSAMDCGHYTSYVKHEDSWYHYNDLSVTSMSRFEALAAAQTTAYVVFFVSSNL